MNQAGLKLRDPFASACQVLELKKGMYHHPWTSFLKSYLFYTHTHTHTHTQLLSSDIPEEGIKIPITDGCEPQCGCWELKSGLLEEQSVLLTAEPFLQPSLGHLKRDLKN